LLYFFGFFWVAIMNTDQLKGSRETLQHLEVYTAQITQTDNANAYHFQIKKAINRQTNGFELI
jgi:hypothetical protein